MNRLAIKIKEARLKAKMSEKDLAKACGQNINYILQIESGKKVINEQIAEQILKILGEKIETFQDAVETEKPAPAPNTAQKQLNNQSVKKSLDTPVTPNDQWMDALSGVIRSFPITDEMNGKVLAQKELLLISKKIEGISVDKVSFIKVTSEDMPELRIMKGDVVLLQQITDFASPGIYYFEYQGRKQLRFLSKIQNNILGAGSTAFGSDFSDDLKKFKIMGKAIKVEFML